MATTPNTEDRTGEMFCSGMFPSLAAFDFAVAWILCDTG